MFSKRSDGRVVHNIDPFQKIVPYIMRTRTDSMNYFTENILCEGMDTYIQQKKEAGETYTYLQILVASVVRVMAQKPQLNRFVVRGRVYARNHIRICFVVHQTMRDNSAGTTIKLTFQGTETLAEVAARVEQAVLAETMKKTESNSTDQLAAKIMNLPSPIIRTAVNSLMWMDRHNILPKSVIEASPFHTSCFITNMKSLGINQIYHHVYEFGTTGLFIAMGKERDKPIVDGKDEIVSKKQVGLGVVTDERFCDGMYFARAFKLLRRYLGHPELLEKPLEKIEEDVE